MPKVIISVLLLTLSPLSHADCKSATEKVIKASNYYPGSYPVNWDTYVECRVWPADPTKIIAALVDPQKASDANPGADDELSDLEVLVLEADSGNILQRLFKKALRESEWVTIGA